MITYADTEKMDDIAREILSATNDLENEVDSMFKRFSKVPNVTKEWVGNQANYYFAEIYSDKKQYDKLIEKLRKFSREINSSASNIRSIIKANNQ